MGISRDLSPQKKFELGLPLSAEDIAALLRDPSSPLAQFYAQCQAENAAMERFIFILFMSAIVVAERAAFREREAEVVRSYHRYEADYRFREESEKLFNPEIKPLPQLSSELDALLSVPYKTLDSVQLDKHYQAISNNVGAQIVAQLGPSVTLKSGRQLSIDPAVIKPRFLSAVDVLKYNPDLAKTVLSSKDEHHDIQQAFAVFHAKAEFGPLGVIRTYRQILDAHQIPDLPRDEKTDLMRVIDTVLAATKMKKLLSHHLVGVNKQSLQMFSKTYALKEEVTPVSLTASSLQPASLKPTANVKVNENEDDLPLKSSRPRQSGN